MQHFAQLTSIEIRLGRFFSQQCTGAERGAARLFIRMVHIEARERGVNAFPHIPGFLRVIGSFTQICDDAFEEFTGGLSGESQCHHMLGLYAKSQKRNETGGQLIGFAGTGGGVNEVAAYVQF